MKLEEQVMIVSGSGRGIGRATALRLAREGARVVIVDRDEEPARETEKGCKESLVVLADVTEPDSAGRIVGAALKRYGRIDSLVNNAGAANTQSIAGCTDDEWRKTMDVNLTSAFVLSRACLDALEDSGRGSIVNVSSVHALRPVSGMFPYNVAKAGMLALTQMLALEGGRRGVRANAVLPGYIRTRFDPERFDGTPQELAHYDSSSSRVPLQRAGSPEEVASVIAFLISAEASFITGTSLVVDGGLTAQLQDYLEW